MTSNIDPIEFGRLVQSVETLTENVHRLTEKVLEMEGTMTGSKGIAIGLTIAAGGIGAGVSKMFERIGQLFS